MSNKETIMAAPKDRSLESFKEWVRSITAKFGGVDDMTETEWRQAFVDFWLAPYFEHATDVRNPDGTFADQGGATATLVRAKNRAELPAHIQALRVRPDLTDIRYNPDPQGDLMVVGKDKKGRDQYIYNAGHWERQAEVKFGRIASLDDDHDRIVSQLAADRKGPNAEEATCLELIRETGIRPGSETNTQAEKQAYGATTLEGRHVVVEGENVRLQFTGKKGVSLDIGVDNPSMAKELVSRKAAAGDSGRIFRTSDEDLRDYTAGLADGAGYHPKDFRTYKATSMAERLVDSMEAPKDIKSYKAAVKSVATAVSAQLGNTPTIALQSYINPAVFAKWRR